jgi:Plavaka transposase
MSDQTHLTNFSGDKKAWPVYITIGNIPSTKRNRPGSLAVLLLALLPVPPKLIGTTSTDKLQRQINAETLQGVFDLIFQPLRDTADDGIPIDCADGKIRKCFPILSCWIADHMENVLLHGIKSNACPKCEVPQEQLGSASRHRDRDYTRYERTQGEILSGRSNQTHRGDTLETLGIKIGQNVFHGLPRVSAPDLHKPDLLHTVYLGLFKHLMDWIQGFLKKHT